MAEPPRPAGTKRDTPTQLAAAGAPQHAAGRLIAAKYRLERMVAQGGMGTVWEAVDIQLERPVAIKFMSPVIAHDAHARQRFNREAKAAAKLLTPHVVQIFEHGVDESSPYIVMELLKGQDLHTRLKRDRRIPLEEAARIIAQIAKGLRAAHEANIIHRDLKPQNIYLANEDGELKVKILDFGVAKMDDNSSEGTKTGVLLGSPHYMSPEQARGKANIDHRSDVWSLAVIAFRMITGKMAFSGEGQGDVIIAIATAEIPVPSKVNEALPPPIDAFFEKALQRDRDKRFSTAIELATAFASAVRACSDASLLTPAMGHPLRPADDEHEMERTQLLPDPSLPQGMVPLPPPSQPRLPMPSHPRIPMPSQPRMAVPSHLTPQPVLSQASPAETSQDAPSSLPTPAPQSAGTPFPVSQETPYGSQATPYTPATGPSIGVGNAIFTAPPAPGPERKVVGLVAVVALALLGVGIFAAVGGGTSEESAAQSAAESAEAPSQPELEPEPEPSSIPSVASAPSSASSETPPEPSASTSTAASAPPLPKPKTAPETWKQPKPKPGGWDNFGY